MAVLSARSCLRYVPASGGVGVGVGVGDGVGVSSSVEQQEEKLNNIPTNNAEIKNSRFRIF